MSNLNLCIEGFKKNGHKKELIIWFGNSQLHAINNYKINQHNAVSKINDYIDSDYYLFGLSQNNANIQEHYLLFTYLINQVRVDKVILPLIFDDLREDGIRSSLEKAFENHETNKIIKKNEVGFQIYKNYLNKKNRNEVIEKGSLQDNSEEKLNKILNSYLPIWSERSKFRGIVFNSLYKFRNWFFDIDPTSTRKND